MGSVNPGGVVEEAGGWGKWRQGRMIAETRTGVGAVKAAARVRGSEVLTVTVTGQQLCLSQLIGFKDKQNWTLVTVVWTDFNQWYITVIGKRPV